MKYWDVGANVYFPRCFFKSYEDGINKPLDSWALLDVLGYTPHPLAEGFILGTEQALF